MKLQSQSLRVEIGRRASEDLLRCELTKPEASDGQGILSYRDDGDIRLADGTLCKAEVRLHSHSNLVEQAPKEGEFFILSGRNPAEPLLRCALLKPRRWAGTKFMSWHANATVTLHDENQYPVEIRLHHVSNPRAKAKKFDNADETPIYLRDQFAKINQGRGGAR